ncbi:MAG: hypothetical protein SVT56_05935, partial [Chloroflexota bacterium]|nr:hypothetical protein [Chloroflexota bacterium]
DLPLLTPEDVQAFLDARKEPPMIVIAPDHRREGTNMLLIDPADLLTFSFGGQSFEKHTELARSKGADIVIVENERIGLDLDVPEDYERLSLKEAVPIVL